MEKPPFRNDAVRMPTTVGSGPSGSGDVATHEDAKRMPLTVGPGPAGSGPSALPPNSDPKRMPK